MQIIELTYFKEVDLVVISNSMINFGPSAIVKNFIDSICVPNKTFSYKYSKQGDAIGLLTNLNVIIVSTQGAPKGWYPFGNHTEWLKGVFKFIGAQNVDVVEFLGTKVAPNNLVNPKEVSPELLKPLFDFLNQQK
ncbi:FMN-dependent NADH-azoreductase [Mycoplasmopsis gallopavonis]|uniref:FMN-dependent NADH-azoreductase n=1 Tax=Mycoplasmopsis gallopavonis TaxID=76629 RepID=A0A449B065_9BACT|nr:FMN-dependent NADH-azoreductase [Mycoplasmopsis gallopavonis]RIV16856.1 FMN-dependent NADH-azoreductase [Mycoplasmopsis gallopavonis]VEU73160.1 FMN-dependent NADH-azoreductase [Mycoplasmopsis gallopavonis]